MATDTRVWLVTGTSSGLGRALIEAVLSKGERAVATTRSSASLDELAKQYPTTQLLVVQLDLTDATAIASMFDTIKEHFGRLDVVVNNAGYGLKSEIETTPDEIARPIFETLFWGPVNITKHAIRFFREVNPKGTGGRVLQISSITAYVGPPGFGFYSAAKSALETVTLAANQEVLPEWNIKAVIIEPGKFDTKWLTGNMVMGPRHPAYPDDAPGRQFLNQFDQFPQIGDLQRAAQAMITIAGLDNPPTRIQLGTDAWGLAQGTSKAALAQQEEWASLSHSTNQEKYGLEVLSSLGFVV